MCDQKTDHGTLLGFMHTRFREKRDSYKYSATLYRRLDNFCFFVPLMILQCAVSIVYAVGGSNGKKKFFFLIILNF